MARPPRVERGTAQEAAAGSDFGKQLALTLEEAEFLGARAFMNPRLVRDQRLDGILGKSPERRARQPQPGVVRHLQTRNQSEALRIALEPRQVFLLVLLQHGAGVLRDLGILKPDADGVLARMAKRGIAQIVRQGGRGNDGAEIRCMDARQFAAFADRRADDRAKRTRHAGHFEAVREPGADVIVVRQRKNLRLVLQTPEGRGKDDPIRVALKGRALRLRAAGPGAAEALDAEKLGPLHAHGCLVAVRWMKSWKRISTNSRNTAASTHQWKIGLPRMRFSKSSRPCTKNPV